MVPKTLVLPLPQETEDFLEDSNKYNQRRKSLDVLMEGQNTVTLV